MSRHAFVSFVTLCPLGIALLTSCGGDGTSLPSTCAGHAELCDRGYDQVSFAATHNSMADTDSQRFAACQTHDIARQLEDGIRGFMIDTHIDPQDPTRALMCHAACIDGEASLETGMRTITTYLRHHRDAIVTIIFESYVSADVTADAFEKGGAMPYVYAHVRGQAWPTLRTMIETNQRLVVFTDHDGGNETGTYPWYMDQWQYAFQNPYAATTALDFACGTDRGTDAPNTVFIMNHFLTAPTASLALATSVNPYSVLEPHVHACKTEQARNPNFVTVDFYETGDLLRVVDELNGFIAP